jgi:hypothetical protein
MSRKHVNYDHTHTHTHTHTPHTHTHTLTHTCQEAVPARFQRVVASLPFQQWDSSQGGRGEVSKPVRQTLSNRSGSETSREGGKEEWPRAPVFLQRNLEVHAIT